MKSSVRHLSCPTCGGTLGMSEGEGATICPSCKTRSLVKIKGHIPKYAIEPELDLRAAKLAAQRILAGNNLAPDIKKSARFYDAGLYYLPMYELTAERVGRFVSTEVVRQNEVTTEKKSANVLIRDIHFQAPALKLGEWGLENIHLEKLRQLKPIKPFDSGKIEKDAHVFDSTIPPENADIGDHKFLSQVPGDETRLLKKNLRIVFCPVWLIKYTYHNRLYRLVIDGVTGKILFGRGPARDTERIPVMLGAIALLTFPLARSIRFLFTMSNNAEQAGSMILLASVLSLPLLTFFMFVLAMAWNQFRYSGEIVWSGDLVDVERVNKPPETFIEKLARKMAELMEHTMENIEIKRTNRWYGEWEG